MTIQNVKSLLDRNRVRYVTISHSTAYTAMEIAASAHVPGKEVAKVVMIRLDGELAMTVLPASYRVDFDLLKGATGARSVELASEADFKSCFPDCDVGAMPPFGNLYGLPVYVAERLTEDQNIAFNAGSHTELIRMPYRDFERIVKPRVMRFSTVRTGR